MCKLYDITVNPYTVSEIMQVPWEVTGGKAAQEKTPEKLNYILVKLKYKILKDLKWRKCIKSASILESSVKHKLIRLY